LRFAEKLEKKNKKILKKNKKKKKKKLAIYAKSLKQSKMKFNYSRKFKYSFILNKNTNYTK